MVDVARDIAARRAVDGPAAVDLVQIAVAVGLDFAGLLGGEQGAFVFGDPAPLLDRPGGEQAEAGARAADAKGSAGHCDAAIQALRFRACVANV